MKRSRKKRSTEQISYNMSRVRAKGSYIERRMAAALRQRGIRFSCNDRSIIGTPDFVLKNKRVCIFCDSEFWHGFRWSERQKQIKSNKMFWINKIESNMQRDRNVMRALRKQGWTVYRFWESKIEKNLVACISKIKII